MEGEQQQQQQPNSADQLKLEKLKQEELELRKEKLKAEIKVLKEKMMWHYIEQIYRPLMNMKNKDVFQFEKRKDYL